MLVDSHCHLNYEGLSDQIPAVLTRAEDAGVSHMVCICTCYVVCIMYVLHIVRTCENIFHFRERGFQSHKVVTILRVKFCYW